MGTGVNRTVAVRPGPVAVPSTAGRVATGRSATRGRGVRGVSVAARTVVDMSTDRHVCIWFDDGDGIEVVCACGARAERILDEISGDAVIVAIDEDADYPAALSA